MDAQQFLKEFGHVANAPGGIAQLRELILHLAVSGDLTIHDDPVDAWPLLAAIDVRKLKHTEKNRVIAKQSPPLKNAINVPAHWAICRLGDLALTITGGGTPSKTQPDYWGGNIPWASVKDLKDNKFLEDTEDYITEKGLTNSSSNLVPPGRVIVCTRMGLGKVAITRISLAINQDLKALELSPEVNIDFFLILYRTLEVKGKGTTVSGIKQDALLALPAVLPPVGEQANIVQRVAELMTLCDKLETQQQARRKLQNTLRQVTLQAVANAPSPHELQTTWANLATNFGRLFHTPADVAELRQLAMDLAIRGLLTEQQSADEPASKLLKRIALEQQEQVQRGEVKLLKPLPEIKLADAPFDLPVGWAWARFPEVGLFGRGKSKHRPRNDPKLFNPGIYPLVQTGEVARAKNVISEFHSKYSDAGLAQSKMWPKGTLCITIAANIADSATLGFDACFPDSVVGFVPASEIRDEVEYFLLFMKTAKSRLLAFAPSTAQKNINLEILQSLLIPIPPKNEIKRILARTSAINALCDQLASSRSNAQDTGRLLAEFSIAGFTGFTTIQAKEPMKAPQTELIAQLRLGQTPDIKAQAPLASIMTRHQGRMLAKDLFQHFGLGIDAFYAQLKTEVTHGWILEPAVAEVREVQTTTVWA